MAAGWDAGADGQVDVNWKPAGRPGRRTGDWINGLVLVITPVAAVGRRLPGRRPGTVGGQAPGW
jgi:hypothetical protein